MKTVCILSLAMRSEAMMRRRNRAETGGLPQVALQGNEMEQNEGEKNEEELDG